MPATLTATYRIVTPMFIGDANQSATEITSASVKGALRFWWRALNWGKFRNQTGATDESALRELYGAEADLFGATADEKHPQRGQGKFLLRVIPPKFWDIAEKDKVHKQFVKVDAARYLGYGLMGAFGADAGKLVRSCLQDNQTFDIQLVFRQGIDPSMLDAVKALGLLGGLGSRVRHGMGSIALLSLKGDGIEPWHTPTTDNNYHQEIKKLLHDDGTAQQTVNEPPFSAFSHYSTIDHLFSVRNGYTALNELGNAMLRYRSWGRSSNGNKLPDGSISEKRFKDDHDWSKEDSRIAADFHPQRIVFGLPHNYGKRDEQKVTPANHERRASPLLFHVHQIGDTFFGVSIFLRSQFLPTEEGINAGRKVVPAKIEWEWISDFVTGKDMQGRTRFSNRKRIVGNPA